MTSLELSKKIVQILDEKKADNIQAIKVEDLTIVADYFIIASTNNATHVKSLADEVEFVLKDKYGTAPAHIEGYQHANWIILDYCDVLVHIFHEETRALYNLERLWADGVSFDIDELLED